MYVRVEISIDLDIGEETLDSDLYVDALIIDLQRDLADYNWAIATIYGPVPNPTGWPPIPDLEENNHA